jgi:hypothetical protein
MDPFVLENLKKTLSQEEMSIASPASNVLNTNASMLKSLCSQMRIPAKGWSDLMLLNLLTEIALLDSNNFSSKSIPNL